MKKIEQFQITSMSISGFKSYEGPTDLIFGNPTVITGGNGRGKTSIADAIAFVVTGLPFFGERGIDRLHNESNPDVAIRMCFVDETGTHHELTRTRRKNRMTITYDGYEIRQLDLNDMFGERDVFLSILNPLYFIEELGESGKNLLEMYLPMIPHETVLAELSEPVREALKDESLLSPDAWLKRRREEIRGLEERITYLGGQKDLAESQSQTYEQTHQEMASQIEKLRWEISGLEAKQFAGMDTSEMQERLVELSQRYDEAARDDRSDAAEQQRKRRRDRDGHDEAHRTREAKLDGQRRAQKARDDTERQAEVEAAAGVDHRDHRQHHDGVPAKAVDNVADLRCEVHARERHEHEHQQQKAGDDHAGDAVAVDHLAEPALFGKAVCCIIHICPPYLT